MTQSEIKKNRTQAVIQKMKENNYDPLVELIKLGKDPRVDLKTRVDIHQTLIKFVYPTLKHVEVDAQVKQDLVVHVRQFIKPDNVISMEGARNVKQLPGQGQPIGEIIEGDTLDLKAVGGIAGHPDILAD